MVLQVAELMIELEAVSVAVQAERLHEGTRIIQGAASEIAKNSAAHLAAADAALGAIHLEAEGALQQVAIRGIHIAIAR